MTEMHRQFRGEENSGHQDPLRAQYRFWVRQLLSESEDFESVMRATESRPTIEPSLEQWELFSEGVMEKVHETSRARPTLRERWHVLLDRWRASDSRLKSTARVVLAVGVCIVLGVALYLLVQRLFPTGFAIGAIS